MQHSSVENLSLFRDNVDNGNEEVLQLDGPSLMKALSKLESASSTTNLRRTVQDIKRDLLNIDGKLRTIESADREIEFTSAFLLQQLDQIASSETIERALHYVSRLKKSISETRVSNINDINLNRWKEYTDILLDSLWVIDRRENSGVHSADYWGNFIPQIPNQMMKRYTKKGDWVLDTFAGAGTTLIEGQRLGRNTIGVELQETVADMARRLISHEPNVHSVTCEVINDDSRTADFCSILQKHGQASVQLIVMHPPYHDIIRFSEDPRDLSNASSLDEFLKMMSQIVENSSKVLDRGRYLALVIGDKYSKGEWIPLGFLTMSEVLKKGFSLKSIVVKNFEDTLGKRQQKQLWKYRALVGGFYIFKHEYVFIFRKQ